MSASRAIASAFVDSKLTPLIACFSIALGAFAVLTTPREQDPTITVPLVRIAIAWPGRDADEVDERVAQPVSAFLREIPSVEHIVSTSSDDAVMFQVQFPSGLADETAITAVTARLAAHAAELPRGTLPPRITITGSDDVPVLVVAFEGDGADPRALRRVVREIGRRIERMPDVAGAQLIGGSRRVLSVRLDPVRVASHGLSAEAIARTLDGASAAVPIGSLDGAQGSFAVRARIDLDSAHDVEELVVGATRAGVVRLRDVAEVVDGSSEPAEYVSVVSADAAGSQRDAVVLTVRKRRGTNATEVTRRVVESLAHGELGGLVGRGIRVRVVRDDGVIASAKVTTLLEHMAIATAVVMLVVGLALGFRAAMIVGFVIPGTLAFVPFVYQMAGFTLNRITLAAMIFAIGILVDDAIVIIENVHRRFATRDRGRPADFLALTIEAVHEVGSPTILATATVIAALAPTAFLSGMLGQFLLPLPVGASVAMVFSLFVALTLTPYLALRMLRGDSDREDSDHGAAPAWVDGYATVLDRFLASPRRAVMLAAGSALALGVVGLFFVTRLATFRNMPIADVDHMAVELDLPVGTTLASTNRVASDVARALARIPEVDGVEVYSGTPGPLTFLGIARGHEFRSGVHQAELQIRLRPGRHRTSHEVASTVRRIARDASRASGARSTVAEEPLGPPTLGALVAEVYAPSDDVRNRLADELVAGFARSPSVVDVRRTDEPLRETIVLESGADRLALHSIFADAAIGHLRVMVSGTTPLELAMEGEPEPVAMDLQLAPGERADRHDLATLTVTDAFGRVVPIGDVADTAIDPGRRPRFRRDGIPVIFVAAEMDGNASSIYPMIDLARELPRRTGVTRGIEFLWNDDPPESSLGSVRWSGDWTSTYEMNRDLGIAFLVVLALIFVMLAAWYASYSVPLVVMLPIPLSLVGAVPGHMLFGMPLSGMGTIGVIALAGLMVRNSILLVDFARERRAAGATLRDAVTRAGAERVRPILLTAATVVLGDGVLYFDPMMQGLGLTMATGAFVSTAMTLFLVPVAYFWLARRKERATASAEGPETDVDVIPSAAASG